MARTAPGARQQVAFDLRRNLINVLGEDHYPYAEYLYHELAANAYDADATEVDIVEDTVVPSGPGRSPQYDIHVRDNGIGMTIDGLAEWFRLGESSKPSRRDSEIFGRPLIGQIGVGKVAILKVAREWTIETERHHGVDDPVRLRVHVNVDDWIHGRVETFDVETLPPTGRPGTVLTLHGVQTRLRTDRIIRHLQRLPLFKEDFKVRRNGELIKPRGWWGADRTDIDVPVVWEEDGVRHTERVRGEIYVRPEQPKREQAYIAEPSAEADGVRRDPAGIEVRVNGDMIDREFFDHETHGHGVNRIWGWVDADFLPILGNRTGYLKDHPAGIAFRKAVAPIYDKVYTEIRYARDSREQKKKQPTPNPAAAPTGGTSGQPDQPYGDVADGAQPPDPAPAAVTGDEATATRYGEVLFEVLGDKPELAPIVSTPAISRPGRPAKDRVYPARPTGTTRSFVADGSGPDRGKLSSREMSTVDQVGVGRFLPDAPSDDDELSVDLPELTVAVNTAAGIRLRFVPLGRFEGPYRWNLADPQELSLDLNIDHPLYKEAGKAGGPLHRMLCAWLVSMALAEQRRPRTGSAFADEVESVCHELFVKWGERR